MGDATNLVIIFAGELLKKAENLIIMGLHPTDVIQGYELAAIKALEELESKQRFELERAFATLMYFLELSVKVLKQPLTVESLAEAVKPAISSKQYGQEARLSRLVAEAAMIVMPNKPTNFNIDNVRVVKIMGGSFAASSVLHGMVFNREPEGTRDVLFLCSL